MGLLESIFKKPDKNMDAVQGYFKTLTAYQPSFTTFEGGVYEAMQTRAAIHAFAIHASKLKPEVVGSRNEKLKRILSHRPNMFMSTSQFLYRVATIFAATNNVFIAPILGKDMQTVVGYYPLMPERVEIVSVGNKPYLRYSFVGNQKAAIELDRCGVLTQMQFKDDFFGENNAITMEPTLQMIHMQNQGIIEGVKTGASLRFIAKLAQTLKESTLSEERKRLRESNLAMENNGGFLLVDAKYSDVKQIDNKPFIVDASQMELINKNVYNYFGVNEEILQNKYSEQVANAWYEGRIEPFGVMLGLALTNMTFNDHEIAYDNEIMFSANRLQFASSNSKLLVSQQLFDRGILSQNEVRDIWQLPHIAGGDEFFIRGEYVSVKDRQTNNKPADEINGALALSSDAANETGGNTDETQP